MEERHSLYQHEVELQGIWHPDAFLHSLAGWWNENTFDQNSRCISSTKWSQWREETETKIGTCWQWLMQMMWSVGGWFGSLLFVLLFLKTTPNQTDACHRFTNNQFSTDENRRTEQVPPLSNNRVTISSWVRGGFIWGILSHSLLNLAHASFIKSVWTQGSSHWRKHNSTLPLVTKTSCRFTA